jgi:hypothetical protein
MDNTNNDCGGARAGGSVIKLPPKSGTVITDYGSGSGSVSFMCYQIHEEIFRKKSWFLKNS